MMLYAAINALSWFYLSEGWSDLFGGTQNAATEAVGFPFQIWQEGASYGPGWVIDFYYAAVDLLVGGVFICVFGWLAVRYSDQLSPLLQVPTEDEGRRKNRQRTFSVRGLFLATTIAAVFIAAVQSLGLSSKLLTAIYLAGPAVLILVAMAPVGMPWKHRVVLLILFAVVMLGGSLFVGHKLGMEFDRVLMGVYICWVPQSVFAVVMVLLWSWLVSNRSQRVVNPPKGGTTNF